MAPRKAPAKCTFCGHGYKAHDFTNAQSVIADVPCVDCPDGICRSSRPIVI